MGTERAHDFPVDDGMTQRSFGDVVGGFDIGAVEKDKQALAIEQVTALELGGLGLLQVAL